MISHTAALGLQLLEAVTLPYKSQREKSDKARKQGTHAFKVQDDIKGK